MGRGRGNSQTGAKSLNTSMRVSPRQDSCIEQLEDIFQEVDEYDSLDKMSQKSIDAGAYDANDFIKKLRRNLQEDLISEDEAIALKYELDKTIGWDSSISNLSREDVAKHIAEPLDKRINISGFADVKDGIALTIASSMKHSFENKIGWDSSISTLTPKEIQASFQESL